MPVSPSVFFATSPSILSNESDAIKGICSVQGVCVWGRQLGLPTVTELQGISEQMERESEIHPR